MKLSELFPSSSFHKLDDGINSNTFIYFDTKTAALVACYSQSVIEEVLSNLKNISVTITELRLECKLPITKLFHISSKIIIETINLKFKFLQ